jgi:hypothetical protein
MKPSKTEVLISFWAQLEKLTRLTFIAKNGKGTGSLLIKKAGDNILITKESGSWKDEKGSTTNFIGSFRWTLSHKEDLISLEHMRYGENHPVFLFYLIPLDENTLISVESHLCNKDSYSGKVYFDSKGINLNWSVIGPKKNEEIRYYYS